MLTNFLKRLFLFGIILFGRFVPLWASQKCREGAFYDENVFTWRSCSICFKAEGEAFAWECKHCNCILQAPANTTTEPTTTHAPVFSTVTTEGVGNTAGKTTENITGTIQVVNPEATQPPEKADIPKNHTSDWKVPLIIVCIAVLMVLVGGVAVLYLHRRHTSCFRCTTKKPTQCTSTQDLNRGHTRVCVPYKKTQYKISMVKLVRMDS